MKKIIFLIVFLCISITAFCESKVTVNVFHSSHCKICLELRTKLIPSLKDKYGDAVEWRMLEIDDNSQNLSQLLSLVSQFKKEKSTTPSILVGDVFLSGKEDIYSNIEQAIEVGLSNETKTMSSSRMDLVEIFKSFSVLAIMGSGLVDGINPCAFAVIIFFVSFLAVYGYRKREIVYIGTSYCLAVFLTYLLIGLGLFKFLYALSAFYLVMRIFYYLIAFFCFLFAGFALYDYFKVKKSKKTDELILQLPKFLKKRINTIIGSRLRDKKRRGPIRLLAVSFLIGFLVSLLEAVCTGQVYVPTIVFILKNSSLRLKAWAYLLLYNVMFIMPLVVIFVLTLIGYSSEKFNNFLKSNMGRIKIIMAVTFFALGSLILFFS